MDNTTDTTVTTPYSQQLARLREMTASVGSSVTRAIGAVSFATSTTVNRFIRAVVVPNIYDSDYEEDSNNSDVEDDDPHFDGPDANPDESGTEEDDKSGSDDSDRSDLDIVKENGLMLGVLGDPTPQVVLAAVLQNKDAFEYVELDILTERMVKRMLATHKCLITKLPITYITKKRLLRAVANNPLVLEEFTNEHYQYVTGKDLIRVSAKAYNHIDPTLINESLCQYAVVRHNSLYQHIPDKYKTKEFNRIVVQMCPQLIGSICELHINRKLVRLALERDADVLELLPVKWQNDYASGLMSNGQPSNDSEGESTVTKKSAIM